MKIRISYSCEKEIKGAALLVMEGQFSNRAFSVGKWIHPRPDAGMAVLCRGGTEETSALLEQMRHWFQDEFPRIAAAFSTDVVYRYWEDICRTVPNTGCEQMEFSVLLVFYGQYVFCGRGDMPIYEYSFDRRRYRRWHTHTERQELNQELGICSHNVPFSNYLFKSRSISEHVLFLILPEQVRPENPKKIKNKHQIKKIISHSVKESGCAIAVCCDTTHRGKRRKGRYY